MRKKEVEEEGDTPSTISFLSAALRLRGDSDPTMMCGAAVNEKNWLDRAHDAECGEGKNWRVNGWFSSENILRMFTQSVLCWEKEVRERSDNDDVLPPEKSIKKG